MLTHIIMGPFIYSNIGKICFIYGAAKKCVTLVHTHNNSLVYLIATPRIWPTLHVEGRHAILVWNVYMTSVLWVKHWAYSCDFIRQKKNEVLNVNPTWKSTKRSCRMSHPSFTGPITQTHTAVPNKDTNTYINMVITAKINKRVRQCPEHVISP